MHLGNAYSALLGWLWARAEGGQFLLRIEDLDRGRSRPEYVEQLFADLSYLGLDWDEPPLFQSQRQAIYDGALEVLRQQGRLYECFCTRAEIARAASAPHGASDEGPIYPGTCARLERREQLERALQRNAALRFCPRPGTISFEDHLHGRIEQDVSGEVGDFVVRRNDGVASYQLAVVVDDAASGITHVLRGDDLLDSTPRQLQLYEALSLTPPAFAHVPLLHGPDGKRLAKRAGAFAVAELRALDVPAGRVVGLLARWAGIAGGEARGAAELVERFSLSRLPRTPVVTSEEEIRRALGC
jgi:glutamyl-tRNA synthetase